MDKVLQVFHSFDDADRADEAYYAEITPEERVDILLDLVANYPTTGSHLVKLQEDLREFIELLNSLRVDYIVIGGHAVAFHGHPRFTGDMSGSSAEEQTSLWSR